MPLKILNSSINVIREEGLLRFISRTSNKLSKKYGKYAKPKSFQLMVKEDDVLMADFIGSPYHSPTSKKKTSYLIDWVISPPGKGSGGHQTIFRHIRALEDAGHTCRIRFYTNIDHRPKSEILAVMKSPFFTQLNAKVHYFEEELPSAADAVFATGWETAYPVFNITSKVKKFYFVQDFEPYFYPVGSESVLAENTYRFNFYGLTAGQWLAYKLAKDYGMKTDYFDFGVDHNIYNLRNGSDRRAIFAYVRPITSRRGFELAIMALKLFNQQRPEYEIHLAGWDTSEFLIPFPCISHGIVSMERLSDLYNQSKAALVLSLTNMSLLPHELLACGCVPLLNDGDNNTMVSDNKFIEYSEASPASLAKKLVEIVDNPISEKRLGDISGSVQRESWATTTKRFVSSFEKFMSE